MKCLLNNELINVSSSAECFTAGGEILLSQSDYPSFNTEFFILINGFILLSFLTGHFSGRLVRWMSKI